MKICYVIKSAFNDAYFKGDNTNWYWTAHIGGAKEFYSEGDALALMSKLDQGIRFNIVKIYGGL